MATLQDKQAPIDRQLIEALIAATPESWDAADMVAERRREGDVEKMAITITNPHGRKELVGATDDIYEGLYRLSDLFARHGQVWRRVRYSIGLDDRGAWKYEADFEY
jgi:hypothetical protein